MNQFSSPELFILVVGVISVIVGALLLLNDKFLGSLYQHLWKSKTTQQNFLQGSELFFYRYARGGGMLISGLILIGAVILSSTR